MAISTIDNTGISASAAIATSKLGTGSILQAQSASIAGAYSVSATYPTWYDITGYSVDITPKFATSKILVIADMNCFCKDVYTSTQIVRNGTPIYQGSGGTYSNGLMEVYPIYAYGPWGFRTAVFLDSPASTATQTYKVQVANISSGTYVVYVGNRGDGIFAVPSSITVMEIAA
jgi:hypothetical protein